MLLYQNIYKPYAKLQIFHLYHSYTQTYTKGHKLSLTDKTEVDKLLIRSNVCRLANRCHRHGNGGRTSGVKYRERWSQCYSTETAPALPVAAPVDVDRPE